MNVIQQLEKEQQKKKTPALRAGDTVRVHAKVVEGTRERERRRLVPETQDESAAEPEAVEEEAAEGAETQEA